jgi:magnesium chelatase family protein
MLVAAMNPCLCRYFGDPIKECTCSPMMVTRYRKRISGPLLDRIDIHIAVPRVECDPVVAGRTVAVGETGGKLTDERLGEPSASVRARSMRARETRRQRFDGALSGARGDLPLLCNADMGPAEVREPSTAS